MNKILKYFITAIDVLAIGCLGVKKSPPAYYSIVECHCQSENFKNERALPSVCG